MERVRFIEHNGKKILFLDFSRISAQTVLSVIVEAKAVIRTQPPRSVLTLSDVTGAGFNEEVTQAMKDFVVHNKPYVTAAAVVGANGFRQVILNSVMWFSGRRLHAFSTADEAKDWLVGCGTDVSPAV